MSDARAQRHTAARHDAFLYRRPRRMQRVVYAVLTLLHLDLGGAAHADHRHSARELRQTLLQFLAVESDVVFLDL